MAQGLEQRRNGEGRDHDCDVVILVDDPSEQVLQGEDKTKVDQDSDCGQRAIHQRAVDDDINVPQAGAQDSNPKCDWNEKGKEGNGSFEEDTVENAELGRTCRREKEDRQSYDEITNKCHCECIHYPFRLLTLDSGGNTTIAVNLGDYDEDSADKTASLRKKS